MVSILKAFLLGSIISILGLLSYWIAPGLDIEERYGLDLLFLTRGNRPPPDNTVIIAIDKIASNYYHLPNNPAKWPR
ncbi:MAG: adenylate/guanylate cyclase domain-containing protein, partial [Thiohalomonadales bacterium]